MVALISTNSCLEESLQEALGITAEESVPCPNGTCHFWTQAAFTTEFHPILFGCFFVGGIRVQQLNKLLRHIGLLPTTSLVLDATATNAWVSQTWQEVDFMRQHG